MLASEAIQRRKEGPRDERDETGRDEKKEERGEQSTGAPPDVMLTVMKTASRGLAQHEDRRRR